MPFVDIFTWQQNAFWSWLRADQVETIDEAGDSGTYRVYRFDHKNANSGLQGLEIKKPTTKIIGSVFAGLSNRTRIIIKEPIFFGNDHPMEQIAIRVGLSIRRLSLSVSDRMLGFLLVGLIQILPHKFISHL